LDISRINASAGGLEALFEQRSVVQHEHPLRDVNAAVAVHADQVVVERSMVDPGEDKAVRDDSLAKWLVGIGFDAAPSSLRP
jgi:hypothetical protein